jgi:hypothetical protein
MRRRTLSLLEEEEDDMALGDEKVYLVMLRSESQCAREVGGGGTATALLHNQPTPARTQ